jgi:hypothetical protein
MGKLRTRSICRQIVQSELSRRKARSTKLTSEHDPNGTGITNPLSRQRSVCVSGLERVALTGKTDNCDALLLAAGGRQMLWSVRVCCCLYFGLARINLDAIALTSNQHSIEIVGISIFLEGDSRLTLRL